MKQSFIEGAVIVSAGGIAAKILGAFYRIPLTNLLGGQGMGVYQMVYPLYCLLLTLASAGVPAGLSRIVSVWEARGAPSRGVLSRALLLFGAVGGAGSLLMLAAAGGVSALQGEPAAAEAYRMLAPSVFLVALISCFRGWFQGRHNFLPTALSETAEQAVKAALGLSFAYVFRADVYRAVSYALLSVTASELFALLLLVALSLPAKKPLYAPASPPAKSVFRVTLPVAAAAPARARGHRRHGAVRAVRGGGFHPRQPARLRLLRAGGGRRARRVGVAGTGRKWRARDRLRPQMHPVCIPSRGGVFAGIPGADVRLSLPLGRGGRRPPACGAGAGAVTFRRLVGGGADPFRLPHGLRQAQGGRLFDGGGGGGEAGAGSGAALRPRGGHFRGGICCRRLLFGCASSQFVL